MIASVKILPKGPLGSHDLDGLSIPSQKAEDDEPGKEVEYFNANREAFLKKSEELKEAAKEHLAVPACTLSRYLSYKIEFEQAIHSLEGVEPAEIWTVSDP